MRISHYLAACALLVAPPSGADELDALLERATTEGRIPAIVAMAASADDVLYVGAAGYADVANEVPVTVDSIFRIASMTKPLTSLAAMQLAQQGKLRLEAPMSDYLPDFEPKHVLLGVDNSATGEYSAASYTPTLQQLLTHTSGFAYSVWNQSLFAITDFSQYSPTYYRREPLVFEPGTAWAYGTSTDWLGWIVETVTGSSLEAYFAQHVTGPLGMADTAYNLPANKHARVVTRHQRNGDGSLRELPNDDLNPSTAFLGGGGLRSTAADYVRFMQAFLDADRSARVLNADIAAMSSPQSGNVDIVEMQTAMPNLSNDFAMHPEVRSAFGFGFEINLSDVPGRRQAGSLAWAGLYNTYFWIDPQSELCGVLLTQLTPFYDDDVTEVFVQFERLVYEAFAD